MWQDVQGQDPHPLLEIPAVGGDDVTLALPRRQLLQALADAAHQLGGLGRGLVRRLPAALDSSLRSAGLLGRAGRGLRPDVRLRGLTGGRLRRRTDGTRLRFGGVLRREAGPGLAVLLVRG